MARTTQQLREAYSPACSERERQGARDAWTAFDACLRWAHYEIRVADSAFRSCRPITGGVGYSLHAYFIEGVIRFWNWARDGLTRVVGIGVAVDINWRSNPYGPVLVTDMPRPMVEAILAIRTVDGVPVFRWGGYYRGNKDAMHYELIAIPAELARGIDWSTVVGSAVTPGPHPVPPVQSDEEEEAEMFIVVGAEGVPALYYATEELTVKSGIPDMESYNELIKGKGFGGHFRMTRDALTAIALRDSGAPGL